MKKRPRRASDRALRPQMKSPGRPTAGRLALVKREERGPEPSTDPIRTYTARPAGGIESLVERTLPSALGLLGRAPIPDIENTQQLESLIDAAHILGDNPEPGIYEARWSEVMERAGDRPIWMLNFLEFAETARLWFAREQSAEFKVTEIVDPQDRVALPPACGRAGWTRSSEVRVRRARLLPRLLVTSLPPRVAPLQARRSRGPHPRGRW